MENFPMRNMNLLQFPCTQPVQEIDLEECKDIALTEYERNHGNQQNQQIHSLRQSRLVSTDNELLADLEYHKKKNKRKVRILQERQK